jgi:nucleotidyltransferase/DNA polymerase involved in DNA repair
VLAASYEAKVFGIRGGMSGRRTRPLDWADKRRRCAFRGWGWANTIEYRLSSAKSTLSLGGEVWRAHRVQLSSIALSARNGHFLIPHGRHK